MKLFSIFIGVFTLGMAGIFFFVKMQSAQKVTVVDAPMEISDPIVRDAIVPDVPKEVHPDSIDALQAKDFTGDALTLGSVLSKTNAYTRYYVTYKSEGLSISGILNIPLGDGPFPVLFLNHGYIDPAIYTNGRGLKREQDYFARNGYAVFHSDYRDHADSDVDPYEDLRPRTGYTEDVINAVIAVKNSEIESLDKERFGMLGHSMGGGVTFNVMVAKPDLIRAHVLYAPISPLYRENFERYISGEGDAIASRIIDRYGTFEESSEYWASVSAINYFDDIAAPVMIHHGTADADVPYAWSERSARALQDAGKDVTFYTYENENHEFGPQWTLFMERSRAFFDQHVK